MKAVALLVTSMERVLAIVSGSVLFLASCSVPFAPGGGASLAPGTNVAQAAVAGYNRLQLTSCMRLRRC